MEYKAIETYYNDILFRSRNEAKWARLFDLIRIKYVYEPLTVTGWNGMRYKPDFYFPQYDIYGEVKSNADGILNTTMANKLNGAIDFQFTPVSNGLLLLGAFPFDIRVRAIRLRTKWLYWHKGVCCGDAYIQQSAGIDAKIDLITNGSCGDPLPETASPDIFIESFHAGSFMTIAINDVNEYFNTGKHETATSQNSYEYVCPF